MWIAALGMNFNVWFISCTLELSCGFSGCFLANTILYLGLMTDKMYLETDPVHFAVVYAALELTMYVSIVTSSLISTVMLSWKTWYLKLWCWYCVQINSPHRLHLRSRAVLGQRPLKSGVTRLLMLFFRSGLMYSVFMVRICRVAPWIHRTYTLARWL
jgi:hypothetical protein